jgi:hypothetical protein
VARIDALTPGPRGSNERVRVLLTLDGDVGALAAAGTAYGECARRAAIGDVEPGNLVALAATGRGEGSGRPAFDRLVDVPPEKG